MLPSNLFVSPELVAMHRPDGEGDQLDTTRCQLIRSTTIDLLCIRVEGIKILIDKIQADSSVIDPQGASNGNHHGEHSEYCR